MFHTYISLIRLVPVRTDDSPPYGLHGHTARLTAHSNPPPRSIPYPEQPRKCRSQFAYDPTTQDGPPHREFYTVSDTLFLNLPPCKPAPARSRAAHSRPGKAAGVCPPGGPSPPCPRLSTLKAPSASWMLPRTKYHLGWRFPAGP